MKSALFLFCVFAVGMFCVSEASGQINKVLSTSFCKENPATCVSYAMSKANQVEVLEFRLHAHAGDIVDLRERVDFLTRQRNQWKKAACEADSELEGCEENDAEPGGEK